MAQISHREQLIDGAIKCLQSKGYARTTARDIAAASGANLASIGYHFGSKEGLLNEALVRIFVERNRYVAALTFGVEEATPLERLTTTFKAVREIFDHFRPVLVAFVEAIAQSERSADLRRLMADHYREARRSVGTLLRTGLGHAVDDLSQDPEVFASLVLAVFDGLVVQYLLDAADTQKGEDLVGALSEWMSLALKLEKDADRRRGKTRPRRKRAG